MLRIAGQTAGPIGLNFLWTLMGAHVQKVELQKVEWQKVKWQKVEWQKVEWQKVEQSKGRTIKR